MSLTPATKTAPLNSNKIVTLTSNYNGSDLSWRNQLSNLLGLNNIENNHIVGGSDLDVDENVHLLIEDKLPAFNFRYGKAYPINETIEAVNSLIPDKWKNIAKGVMAVTEVASAVADDAVGANAGAPGTTSVFNPWTKSMPAWDQKLEPLKFTYTFNFKIGQSGLWNAKQEVFLPIVNLMAPVLPRSVNSWMSAGPIPGRTELLTDSIIGIFRGGFNQQMGDLLAGGLTAAIRSFTYDVQFGNTVRIYNCLIDSAKPAFSGDTDEAGYPVAGSIELGFSTTAPYALSSSENAKSIKFGVNG